MNAHFMSVREFKLQNPQDWTGSVIKTVIRHYIETHGQCPDVLEIRGLPDLPLDQAMPCAWTMDYDGNYDTDCNNAFVFNCEGPRENGFKWCPYCGRQIKTMTAATLKGE